MSSEIILTSIFNPSSLPTFLTCGWEEGIHFAQGGHVS